ncbi:hypothetical protein SHKM778_88710 [Streptomyces sp. KM77-8]|uniref:Uncharacterized protein n=1 Tax=Streptomyces haneummycinicus TaxID=3074435 RepID=A0AAT9HY94_9ACTN
MGQYVPGDGQAAGLRDQLPEPLDGQLVREPPPGLVGTDPHTDVGVPALVAAAGTGDQAEGRVSWARWEAVRGAGFRYAGEFGGVLRCVHGDTASVMEDGHMVDGALGDVHILEDSIGEPLPGDASTWKPG